MLLPRIPYMQAEVRRRAASNDTFVCLDRAKDARRAASLDSGALDRRPGQAAGEATR